ncbi:MAG: FliA/WhiG family RNA polymerase sigma factor, partial [Deltaproteobacteria bacterium HGW-Deltaproteobacteria-16]
MSKQPSPKFKDYTNTFFSQAEPLSAEKRNELILTYTPLIKYIAARLAARLPAQVSLDDLISCGIIGLIDAINKFDVSKNVQFKTYAEFRVKGAMLDELRALDWVPRSVRRKTTDLEKVYADIEKQMGRPATDEEVAKTMGLALDDFYKLLDETKSVSFMDIEFLRQKSMETSEPTLAETFAMDDRDPFTSLNLSQIRELLASAIAGLPEKEKLTVSLYYQEELTMKEIGEV